MKTLFFVPLAIIVWLASPAAAQTALDPQDLCDAGKVAGLSVYGLEYEEWPKYPGQYFCASGKDLKGVPYLRFQVDGSELEAAWIDTELFIDDVKLGPAQASEYLLPLLRALFEAAGVEVPADLSKAVVAVKPGKFATPLGQAIAAYKRGPRASPNTASYRVEIELTAAPAAKAQPAPKGALYAVPYEPVVVRLAGTLTTGKGDTPDDKKTSFPALRLAQPIRVDADPKQKDSPDITEDNVSVIQLNLSEALMTQYTQLKERNAVVIGTLYHQITGHHYTKVLMTVQKIEPQ